ncbi:unnamed protein product, partial [Ixodes pacificus]
MGDVTKPSFVVSLMAGAAAGTTVDLVLFPLDTFKTRLQSQQGFWKAGGFAKIYSGLASAALGSAPTAAVFFCTYEGVKKLLSPSSADLMQPVVHSVAAGFGEVAACIIRVPVEIVKQRTQANQSVSSWQTFRKVFKSEGIPGFYRGYLTTMAREIPFAFIQFPLWEIFKVKSGAHRGHSVIGHVHADLVLFVGGIAAGLTTPFDAAKTRIML